MICEYGCGETANFVLKNSRGCCSKHPNGCRTRTAAASLKRRGIPRSDETKLKMSVNRKGIPAWSKGLTKDTDERLKLQAERQQGRRLTEETKDKIRLAKKGKRPTFMEGFTLEEWSKRFSGEQNGMFGKTHSEQTRQKIADKNRMRHSFSGERNPWFGKERSGALSPRWIDSKEKRKYRDYLNRVAWLTELTYRKYIDEINPKRLSRELCGVPDGYQLDHIVPIFEGFKRDIPPELIAHKTNLRIISWDANRKKHHSLTEEAIQLLEKMIEGTPNI